MSFPFIDLGLFHRGAFGPRWDGQPRADGRSVRSHVHRSRVPEGRSWPGGGRRRPHHGGPPGLDARGRSSRRTPRRPGRRPTDPERGAVLVVAGALGLIAWPMATVLTVVALMVVGLGISAFQSPAAAGATNVVSDAERGVALGVFNTSRFVLGGLGALAAALAFEAAAGQNASLASSGSADAEAGYRAAIAIAALAGLAALPRHGPCQATLAQRPTRPRRPRRRPRSRPAPRRMSLLLLRGVQDTVYEISSLAGRSCDAKHQGIPGRAGVGTRRVALQEPPVLHVVGQGGLTKDAMKAYVQQHYNFVSTASRYYGIIYGLCPWWDARELLPRAPERRRTDPTSATSTSWPSSAPRSG